MSVKQRVKHIKWKRKSFYFNKIFSMTHREDQDIIQYITEDDDEDNVLM